MLIRNDASTTTFPDFVREYEPRIRAALCSAFGADTGREAAADAFVYAWQHWDRVAAMANPVGYLYSVGRSRAKRSFLRRRPVRFDTSSTERLPWVEPALAAGLEKLTDKQRVVVMLVHGLEWSLGETAEVLGVGKSTVQTHLDRGMARLRRHLGVTT